MALNDDDLRRMAAGIRMEQCVRPQNVLRRVLDRVRWGEPFSLLETLRDSLGTLPVPGAFHLRVNCNGRLRWMAMVFGDSALPGASRNSSQVAVIRAQGAEPRLVGSGGGAGSLVMTCGADSLEFEAPGYRTRVMAAYEIVEGPYGLVALASRVKKGLPVGLHLVETR